MLMIEFNHDKPKVEEIAKYSVHFYDKESADVMSDCLGWIEDAGFSFVVIPCEDGIVVVQWYGVNTSYGYTVREIGQ